MKKIVLAAAILLVFSVSAQAQMGGGAMGDQKGHMGHEMMMKEGQQMPMMQMCMPMM